MRILHAAQDLSVLVIGETITDEYVYVYPMAKAPKENVLATREDRWEEFAGGVQVPYRILKTLCKRVDVITQEYEIRKKRFVDHSYMRKLFETYRMGEIKKLDVGLLDEIRDYDLVIVFDFGHGFIGPDAIGHLCHNARFLAVNTQSNSGNMGFNFIHKYPRADFVCIDEPEARLAAIDRDSPMLEVVEKMRIDCPRFIITHGKHGCFTYDDGRSSVVPAITEKVLDTVGAGDTFMSFAAPLIASGAKIEEAAFIGNIAGGLKTGIIGHSDYVKRGDVEKWLMQNRI